jgi:SAM-dependent methyltransferase
MTKILDIWCWNHKTTWAIGIDSIALSGVDIIHNLNVFPYPIEESVFDEIYGNHIIEHLDDVMSFMKELHRIGKNGGKIFLRMPHASCSYSCFSDPTHKRWFTTATFEYFNENSEWSYYSGTRFKLVEKKLHYICYNWERWSRIPKFLQRFLNFFANSHHLLCERIWAWYVGGFEELYIILEIIK